MNKYVISDWINSSGGPLVVMEEAKALLWNGMSGNPSDYDLACQSADYSNKLALHGTDVLVLGDEPLQTAVATSDSRLLIVRWKWADSEADVLGAIEQIDVGMVNIVEKLTINWANQPLVVFDAVDTFHPSRCLRFSAHSGASKVETFIYQPTSRTSLLVHAIAAV
ncbi:Imm21 family immunity protein [Paraburkholderia rhizosphaerae]|uniref:Immunity protein 21 of polymorphic toxin system n=1 Tax=Paraburkholderia rhizosphaerae TaxID=480658 RepID=A0A4R8KPM3_9BURK|nr:Imm21 family immunity protein [Paraburkholderia rhizosphaerae]TDY31248.1 immunity protein 21 of polymorphic toxin system [Paraburkholderia rhizosphaerae]